MKPHAYLLLVDDDPVLLRSTARALGAAGYLVEVAFSAAECRRLASVRRPDLILLDVVLPDESGVDVCRWLKEGAETSKTCVVLISGLQVSSGCQEAGLAAGADAYLVRPIGNSELVARIGALLRVQQARVALEETHRSLGRRNETEAGSGTVTGTVTGSGSGTGTGAGTGTGTAAPGLQFVDPLGAPGSAIARSEPSPDLAVRLSRLFEELLTVISCNTSLIREDPRLDQGLRAYLDNITTATRRGADLTLGLLHYGGQQLSQPRLMELNEVIERLRPRFLEILGDRIALEFGLDPSLPSLFADPGMLEHLLLNLATNARDAMPKGGRFVVTTQVVDVRADAPARPRDVAPGRYLCLSATDKGCGIDPSIRSRVFEPFFTTKEGGKGFGLGLAVAQDIVRQHRGWIDVQGEVGQGSAFRVYLPLPTS